MFLLYYPVTAMTKSWVSFWGLRHTRAFVLKLLSKAKRFNLDDITNDVHISIFKWCVGVMSCSPGWDSRLACKFSCWGSCWWLWRCDQLSSTGSFKKNPRRPAYKHHHDLNLTVNCTQKWRACRKDAVFWANIPTAVVCQAWPWICSIKYWIQVTIGVGWGFPFPVRRKVWHSEVWFCPSLEGKIILPLSQEQAVSLSKGNQRNNHSRWYV